MCWFRRVAVLAAWPLAAGASDGRVPAHASLENEAQIKPFFK